jgi:hypothetical protein
MEFREFSLPFPQSFHINGFTIFSSFPLPHLLWWKEILGLFFYDTPSIDINDHSFVPLIFYFRVYACGGLHMEAAFFE